jgi:hypothetical protein
MSKGINFPAASGGVLRGKDMEQNAPRGGELNPERLNIGFSLFIMIHTEVLKMGLDIYAGTLTRYYAKNWKTVTQQWAERNGVGFKTIRPNEESPQETIPVDEIQEDMRQWSNMITNALIPDGECAAWDENNEKDYYTDKPDWYAFGALLLYGACLQYDLPLPKQTPKDWEYVNDAVVVRALEDRDLNWSLFSSAEWWLPFDRRFLFNCPMPNGDEIVMGTTGALLAELRRINELGWNADDTAILEWSNTEGYPDNGAVVDGVYTKIATTDTYDVQSLAKFAFSILYRAALFSEKHRVPIIMDY